MREAIKGTDDAEVKAASDDLETLWHEAAQSLYQSAGAEGGPAAAEAEGSATGKGKKPGDGAVDADFEVVN